MQSRDTTQTYFNKVNDVVRKGNKQLSKIEIKANNQLKNYYELRRRGVYQDDNSSTLAQQVLGISYCDSEGRCLPETTFEWYRNDPEKFQFEKTINNWGGATDGESEWFFDVNADQKQDYCRPQYSSTVFCKKN